MQLRVVISEIENPYAQATVENIRRTPASLRPQLLKMLERELNGAEADQTVPTSSFRRIPFDDRSEEPTGQTVALDVGISSFATLSIGEEIESPRHLKSALESLQRQQRRLLHRRKGSKRRAKQRIKVAKAHLKVSRCRKNFHHKVSRDLVRRFDAITVEDLNIRGMVKNRCLAQAISDVAWGRFFTMTKGKAEKAGRTFERMDPRYTSRTCSKCGHRQKMPLAICVYECGKCGYVIGRDHNSAITIDRAGQARICARGEGAVAHRRSGNARADLSRNRRAV